MVENGHYLRTPPPPTLFQPDHEITAIETYVLGVSLPFREDMSKFLEYVQLGRIVAEEIIVRG